MVKKGLRSTAQRRLIVDTFFEGAPHVSIEDLLAEVRARDTRHRLRDRLPHAEAARRVRRRQRAQASATASRRYELADDATRTTTT